MSKTDLEMDSKMEMAETNEIGVYGIVRSLFRHLVQLARSENLSQICSNWPCAWNCCSTIHHTNSSCRRLRVFFYDDCVDHKSVIGVEGIPHPSPTKNPKTVDDANFDCHPLTIVVLDHSPSHSGLTTYGQWMSGGRQRGQTIDDRQVVDWFKDHDCTCLRAAVLFYIGVDCSNLQPHLRTSVDDHIPSCRWTSPYDNSGIDFWRLLASLFEPIRWPCLSIPTVTSEDCWGPVL